MKNIKAVLIDIDNTLLDFNKGAEIVVEIAFNKCGLTYKNHYIKTFIEQNDLLWEKIERGELTREGLHKIRFNTIFKVLGITGDGVKTEIEFRKALFNIAVPVEGAQELVKYLSKKYKVYCASNAIYNQQINRLKLSNMHDYFSGFFISEKIGKQKPSKEFFDYCFNNLDGIKPEETIVVGDSLTADVLGAKNYGLKSIWYNAFNVENKAKITPDYTVNELLQIKDIL